nr:site-specific integrase [uncultured Amphritea sp.]
MRGAGTSISRENYLMVALLVVLGVRKMELGAAPWSEFDLEKGIWKLPDERAKKGHGLDIPLTPKVVVWLKELHTRAAGLPYVFPARRASKTPHMGQDTLNAALKLDHKLEHFTVHDLRRSCRTLLSKLGVNPEHADRYTNHIPEGMRRIYDRHDFFEERLAAQEKLVAAIAPLL